MLFNRLTYPLVFAVLLIAGLAFVVTPATGQLSVTDVDTTTTGIQISGIEGESVPFELTVTFPEGEVNGFGDEVGDIELIPTRLVNNEDDFVSNGATIGDITTTDDVVYTTTVTVTNLVEKIWISVPAGAAKTPGTVVTVNNVATLVQGQDTDALDQIEVNIVRNAAPPLTLSDNTVISDAPSFTVTLTSTVSISLTNADISVTGGYVEALAPDAAREVWTITIRRGAGQNQVTVGAAANSAYAFTARTYTVDTTGPVATITGTPVGGGPFSITITFGEPLQTGTTLLTNEITVGGGVISVPFAISNTSYVATLTPSPGVTRVTVQVNAGAVSDVGGILNAATPSSAHIFNVAAIAGPGGTGTGLGVIFSEIANRNNNANEWIEFKNRTSSAQDVGGWIVSIVTAVNTDEFLFSLPDVTIPAGGILLVTDRDPEDTGSSLAKDAPLWRQVNIGALPNEGNFILVLRNSSNRALLGTANQIVDVAGYFPNSAQVAILLGQSAPLSRNNLRANKVYWRQHEDITGTGGKNGRNTDADVAFQPIGYTGVGYERAASQTDENGGTPGWPNDVREGSSRELTDGVTISEIMFATDGSSDEIQWIELFNSSKTQAVALDADDGWSLVIDNYDDPDSTDEPLSGEINFKDSGSVKTILPNQTVLIVSSRGRNSDRDHFPTSRVFDVYAESGNEFDMDSRRDPFLNPTVGFRIELVDGNGRTADEVGNLDWRTRLTDEPAWQLPKGRTKNGDRTSIIRQYRDYNSRTGRYSNVGEVHGGTEREGWIPAANTAFRSFTRNRKTWYGSEFDHGTPGLRAGQALPVQLSHFYPKRTETGAIVIQWTTQSEVDNAGFNILRSQTKTGEFKVVNAQLIPGAGTKAESTTYTWTDATAKPNVVYYYQIEDVSFAGERQTLATVRLRGLITAKGKLTTQWGELKQSRD